MLILLGIVAFLLACSDGLLIVALRRNQAFQRVLVGRIDAAVKEVERLRSLERELLLAKDTEAQLRLAAEAQAQTIMERRATAPRMVRIQLACGITHRVVHGSREHQDAIDGVQGLKVVEG